MDKENRDKIDEAIFGLPKNITKEKMAEMPEWSMEATASSFMATMAGRGQRAN